ncbi:MAG: YgjV family protein [Clostridiales bacterium]|nr:YgjV family protein [Clostridiales bacterium]
MDPSVWIELIGYLGSALVVVSMLMSSVVKLRTVNLVGSAIFTVYALIIRSYPTAAMNLFLVGINVYHLVRLLKHEKQYDLIRTSMDDAYVRWLLESCGEDIKTWFPDFSAKEAKPDLVLLICCDRNPAGLFMGKKLGNGEVQVLLDYATPVYRDTTVGRYLHGRLAQDGVRTLVFRGGAPGHVAYMEKVGYQKRGEGEYALSLKA